MGAQSGLALCLFVSEKGSIDEDGFGVESESEASFSLLEEDARRLRVTREESVASADASASASSRETLLSSKTLLSAFLSARVAGGGARRAKTLASPGTHSNVAAKSACVLGEAPRGSTSRTS